MERGGTLAPAHPIPPCLPAASSLPATQPTHAPELQFRHLLVQAGLPEPEAQRAIPRGQPWGKAVVDFFDPDPTGRSEGLCIYLNGLSAGIPGSLAAQTRDHQIREALRELHYDAQRMNTCLYRVARSLLGREAAEAFKL